MDPCFSKKRKLEDIIKPYFQEQPNGNFLCTVENCAQVITSIYSSNRKRHLTNRHKELSKALKFIDYDEETPKIEEKEKIWHPISKIKKILIEMDADTYIKGCVKMVTLGNVPFSTFMQEGFKDIVAPIEKGLGIVANTQSITKQIDAISNNFKITIRKELKNKLISLKFDCVTMKKVSIIGINAQFIHAAEIKMRTLAMLEFNLEKSKTNLRDEILKVLEEYEIDLNNVYTCTTDNGSNILKAVKLLKGENGLSWDKYSQDNLLKMEEILNEGPDVIQGDELSSYVESELVYLMTPVRCEVHTLKSAVYDFLKLPEVNSQIIAARCMFLKIFKKPCGNATTIQKLDLDDVSSWNSTYEMVKYLIQEKKFSLSIVDVDIKFNPELWSFLDDFLKAFEPIYCCMKKLQEEQLTMGDFYKRWLECTVRLIRVNNHLANLLLKTMKKYKQKLYENEAFVAALYLDPRFNYEGSVHLCETAQIRARAHLEQTWLRLESLLPQTPENNVEVNSELPQESTSELETFMRQMDTSAALVRRTKTNIAKKLTGISYGGRVNVDESVLRYWELKKTSECELYSLSQIVFAVPATQVSVERSFIALEDALKGSETKLQTESISNVLMIKLNQELFKSASLANDEDD